jgi:hypothetical protein
MIRITLISLVLFSSCLLNEASAAVLHRGCSWFVYIVSFGLVLNLKECCTVDVVGLR